MGGAKLFAEYNFFELELTTLFHLLVSNCESVPSGSFLKHHRRLKRVDSLYKLIQANVKNINCFGLNSGQFYQSLIFFFSFMSNLQSVES